MRDKEDIPYNIEAYAGLLVPITHPFLPPFGGQKGGFENLCRRVVFVRIAI
jgi:hypothetical protein